jgi:hypothetical protein
MIREKVVELLVGLMGDNMLVIGKQENSTVKEHILA